MLATYVEELDDLSDVSNSDNSLYVGTDVGNIGTETADRANVGLGQYNLQNNTTGSDSVAI